MGVEPPTWRRVVQQAFRLPPRIVTAACCCSAGSASIQRIAINRTGTKFPPHKYEAAVSPGTAVDITTGYNGQPVVDRRVLQPTLVSSRISVRALDEPCTLYVR